MNDLLNDGWARRIFFFASPENARFLEDEAKRLGTSRSDYLGQLLRQAREARDKQGSAPKATSS